MRTDTARQRGVPTSRTIRQRTYSHERTVNRIPYRDGIQYKQVTCVVLQHKLQPGLLEQIASSEDTLDRADLKVQDAVSDIVQLGRLEIHP